MIGFGLALPWLDPAAPKQDVSLAKRVYDSFPVFILLFLAASLIRTVGLTGDHAAEIQLLGRWVMVIALAAVGLLGHWRAFAGAGARPAAVRRPDLVRGRGDQPADAGFDFTVMKYQPI